MKKTYNAPVCEIVVMNDADVITSSPAGREINLFGQGYGTEIELDGISFE
ncbi:MAG: hypothetical protein ACI3X1_04005 [Eubacteriales bacterium]